MICIHGKQTIDRCGGGLGPRVSGVEIEDLRMTRREFAWAQSATDRRGGGQLNAAIKDGLRALVGAYERVARSWQDGYVYVLVCLIPTEPYRLFSGS
jgi:hypothetical protein